MNIINAMNSRYIIRQFSDVVIDEYQFQKLLNSARLSTSFYVRSLKL
jgi:nitroreductase